MNFLPEQEAEHLELLYDIGIKLDSSELNSILRRIENTPTVEGCDYWVQAKESLLLYILDNKDNCNFVDDSSHSNLSKAKRLNRYMIIIDGMIKQLIERDAMFELISDYAEQLFSPKFISCGNNSDWSIPAWYVGINEPNKDNGDRYILDHGDGNGRYTITQKTYLDSGTDRNLELISIDTRQAKDAREGYEMLDLLWRAATYIAQTL